MQTKTEIKRVKESNLDERSSPALCGDDRRSPALHVDYLSKIPPEIIRKIFINLETKDVIKVCSLSKYFKEKVCTDYFWQLYINNKYKYPDGSLAYASSNGLVDRVRVLLKDKRVNPAVMKNFSIIQAAENGYSDVVKLLLKDSRLNPTAEKNKAFSYLLKMDILK